MLEGEMSIRILFMTVLLCSIGCTPSDYCNETKRPLSDEELIAKVVSKESIYPNCCRVSRGNPLEIETYLKLSNADSQKHEHLDSEYYESHLIVNACGKVLDTYGMQIKSIERPCWARKEKIDRLSDIELVKAALRTAAKQMKLVQSQQSIEQFIIDHPSCCQVLRDIQDEYTPKNPTQARVEVYYATNEANSNNGDDFLRIRVYFNECGDWGKMIGPSKVTFNHMPSNSSFKR